MRMCSTSFGKRLYMFPFFTPSSKYIILLQAMWLFPKMKKVRTISNFTGFIYRCNRETWQVFSWSVDNCDYSHLWKWWVMPKIEHLSNYCHGLLTLHSVPDLFLVPWVLVMNMHFTSISSHLFLYVYIVKNSMNVISTIQGILFSWIES